MVVFYSRTVAVYILLSFCSFSLLAYNNLLSVRGRKVKNND